MFFLVSEWFSILECYREVNDTYHRVVFKWSVEKSALSAEVEKDGTEIETVEFPVEYRKPFYPEDSQEGIQVAQLGELSFKFFKPEVDYILTS